MTSPKRCVFLAGAPEDAVLSWDESRLLSRFETRLRRFLGQQQVESGEVPALTPTAPLAKWRMVECDDIGSRERPAMLGPTITENVKFHQSNLTGRSKDSEDLQFLEHSIALLDDLDSSQILNNATRSENDDFTELHSTYFSFATSFTDTSTHISNDSPGNASPTQQEADSINVRTPGMITDLKRIPKAHHIAQIQPQTITVNLLVGIIVVSPSRTVRLRRRDAEMDILEMTVGDETRAGFSISFWLTPVESQQKPLDDLRETLRHLRPGQIVLLQNVALSCFRGNVYGQSLSKRFARNSTTINTIQDEAKKPLADSAGSKLRRVRAWVSDFVGETERFRSFGEAEHVAKKRRLDELPPDTQE